MMIVLTIISLFGVVIISFLMSTVLKSKEALMGEYIKMLVWIISVLKDIFCLPRDTIRTPAPHKDGYRRAVTKGSFSLATESESES